MDTIKITSGDGTARPVFPESHLYPSALDDALGATEAREAWEATNAEGERLFAVYRAAEAAFFADNPAGDFPTREAWLKAKEIATRKEEAAVRANTPKAIAALKEYHRAQRAGAGSTARAAVAEAYLNADKAANDAMNALDKAVMERERLGKMLALRPERGARNGRGHFMFDPFSSGLGLDGSNARADVRRVVEIAPRALVREILGRTK